MTIDIVSATPTITIIMDTNVNIVLISIFIVVLLRFIDFYIVLVCLMGGVLLNLL